MRTPTPSVARAAAFRRAAWPTRPRHPDLPPFLLPARRRRRVAVHDRRRGGRPRQARRRANAPTPPPPACTRPPAARGCSAPGELPRPEPAPGGVHREYWIQARSVGWNIVPTGRDDWHGRKITGKTSFRAYVYQEMTAGFAAPKGGINMPGPTLYAEVGDVLVVHFRNADTQAAPGRDDASARRPLQPRVRRRLPGQVHARRRVRRARRGVHVLLGVHPRTRPAPGPTTTTAPTTRSTRSAACSARS